MEVFIARQPIYDRRNKIIGYELLFRNNQINNKAMLNNDSATAEVLINSFVNFDFKELTNNTYGFINFTEKFLLEGVPEAFSPTQIVIELLEDIKPTDAILRACKYYKNKGYKIALDDFQMDLSKRETIKIMTFIDIIKVDFQNTDLKTLKQILKLKNFFPIKLLAEKIETYEEYQQCYKEGFDYFQGYYFQKPVILSTQEIPISFFSYMQIIKEMNKPEPEIKLLTEIIEKDLSLSHQLLKLINRNYKKEFEIQSIQQAIVRLGLVEFQRWIYILSLRELKKIDELTNELIQNSLVRGKFCELFAKSLFQRENSNSYFLLGMFSQIDGILNRPMEEILKELPLQKEITAALLGNDNHFREVLNIIIAIEHADWDNLNELEQKFEIENENIFSIYMEAIRWAKSFTEQ
ncbi:EAL and HDOD domain-containing protein [Pallidibacillus pasinlerensis]|uniref:EAL domain-containing protein n=1 Tax=Pallidibacillus pasinlerensis TaxID=2703818 RepID=A0ABW9ZZ36_9BACI|nr:EAL domain-containing protein [Pallidibacillus pasinlerensis]NCU16430.1 EAL domain-containing protein [Pallidibacillus pasinlerensis]